jgi:hypothetical protein
VKYLLCLALIVGCSTAPSNDDDDYSAVGEKPTMNLPLALRQRNWIGERGSGSCVHASMVSLFRWQGRYQMAEHWRSTYGDGAGPEWLDEKLDEEGVRYAQTVNGDESFLEWALRTRRGCGISYWLPEGNHFVDLVYLDDTQAAILDNNETNHFIWMSREELLDRWRAIGGWAITPVYAPAAPLPQPEAA